MMRDAEMSLLRPDENRLGPYEFGRDFVVFDPQYRHERLLANPDYVRRFAERAAAHRAPGGALSPERTIPRFRARASEIDQAVIAESARRVDAKWPDQPPTRAHWLVEIDRILSNDLPFRSAVASEQFRLAGLLPTPPDGDGDGAGVRPFIGLRQIGHLRPVRPGVWRDLADRRDG